jgi:hypothetical protein
MKGVETILLLFFSLSLFTLAGLPDGLFSNQICVHFEGLRLENVEIFYGHLEYFTDIWDIL